MTELFTPVSILCLITPNRVKFLADVKRTYSVLLTVAMMAY